MPKQKTGEQLLPTTEGWPWVARQFQEVILLTIKIIKDHAINAIKRKIQQIPGEKLLIDESTWPTMKTEDE